MFRFSILEISALRNNKLENTNKIMTLMYHLLVMTSLFFFFKLEYEIKQILKLGIVYAVYNIILIKIHLSYNEITGLYYVPTYCVFVNNLLNP